MSQKMKITKKTDLKYAILCLNKAEEILTASNYFNGETAKTMADKIETELCVVGRELNINLFIFASENNIKIPNTEEIDFNNYLERETNREAMYKLILEFKIFLYGEKWLKAQCDAMTHKYERYGGE